MNMIQINTDLEFEFPSSFHFRSFAKIVDLGSFIKLDRTIFHECKIFIQGILRVVIAMFVF